MKTMTCRELGGACDKEFHAATFDAMANLSKEHGMEMMGDESHQEAMHKMHGMMKDDARMKEWFLSKKREFELKPED